MKGFRLLSKNELVGRIVAVFSRQYWKATLTDFAILLGGLPVDYEGASPNYGFWWLEDIDSSSKNDKVLCVGKDAEITSASATVGKIGVRPTINYSLIKPYISSSKVIKPGLEEVEFGEYPNMNVNKELGFKLENEYFNNNLATLSKSYSIGNGSSDNFAVTKCPVYEYEGEKYIRFVPNKSFYYTMLSNNSSIEKDRPYWIKVCPVKWIVDVENDMAVTKDVLFSGVPYSNGIPRGYSYSLINEYLDKYFSNEIENKEEMNLDKTVVRERVNKNSYGFDTSRVTEEDIIRGAIESDVAVFIHGRSSDGKSARVKELDPDCEIIYMRNATPDSLNGKSVYDASTGNMIDVPPTWYTKVVDKCNSEPDKIHIVFFDELTNALPSMQGMAFNIILDHEVNGKWKLPKNARIVAAGNDLSDSLAANKMAEPLFNRFAHVYINTEVVDWLKWAKTPKKEYQRLDYSDFKPERKIHPAVISYIRYKSTSGKDVLRTPFTGDKPNADPRKWEMASKVLYKTGRPEMLRALIGEPLTKDFVEFVRRNLITVDDVINHNYGEEIFDMDISEKFTTAVGLSSVGEEHFEEVRDFISSLGPEVRTTFETMWAGNDEKRLEKVAEARLSDKVKRMK